ncbi:MAG: hypothetical protein MUC29_13850, partial [Pyrinomonadaceae bacterium]|nr:hypothetical protein [Pyrinomonadaceae bacterium]
MKFCPTCQTKYDEEILKFCIKDGTPLVDEKQPTFTEMPSQSSVEVDDIGEETVIVRKPKKDTAQTIETKNPQKINSGERMVISTQPEVKPKPYIQSQTPKKSNTATTVLLTIFGTLAVLGGGFGVWWFLSKETPVANVNSNRLINLNTTANVNTINYNANFNSNLGSNISFNANSNTNANANISNLNTNANLKTPTPTPKPTVKPTIKPA